MPAATADAAAGGRGTTKGGAVEEWWERSQATPQAALIYWEWWGQSLNGIYFF